MKSLFMILSLVLTVEGVHAVDFNEDCGSNLAKVKEIVERKFPQIGTSFISLYHGQWVYPGYDPMVIQPGVSFRIMKWPVLICPRADRKFDVYWVEGKTKAGILGMVSRNQVAVYQTRMGDIAMDRAGTATAGGRW